MKKKLFLLVDLFIFFPVFSLEIPEQLCGIWEGYDRFVFFENQSNSKQNKDEKNHDKENDDEKKPQIVIILKEYYGWYNDRAAEPEEYSKKEERIRNNGTHKTSEKIAFSIENAFPEQKRDEIGIKYEKVDTSAWEIELNYSSNEKNYIPVAIIDNKLYIHFFKKSPSWDKNGKLIISENGYWQGSLETKGITLNSQIIDENISFYILENDRYYDVRYWKSDKEKYFENDNVIFKYNNDEYLIPKIIYSGMQQYTCVSGRSKIVRNPQKSKVYSKDDFTFNEQKTIMVQNKNPYLIKIADKNTFEQLMQIVKENNLRRKSEPNPLFPENDLNWHWDIINELEKDNELIQEVRQRQNDFYNFRNQKK